MSSHGSGDTRFWVTMTLRDDVESLAGPDSLGPGRRGRSCCRWSPGAAWRVIGELIRTVSAPERLRWGPAGGAGCSAANPRRRFVLDPLHFTASRLLGSPDRDRHRSVGSDRPFEDLQRSRALAAYTGMVLASSLADEQPILPPSNSNAIAPAARPTGELRATQRRIGEGRSFTGDQACLKCVRS